MATPRLGLVVEDKPTELSCRVLGRVCNTHAYMTLYTVQNVVVVVETSVSGFPNTL